MTSAASCQEFQCFAGAWSAPLPRATRRVMLDRNKPTEAIELLRTRRSPRIPDLAEPGPDETELETLLTVASRVPDHGKLAPWRFLVLRKEGREPLVEALAACFRADHPQAT